MPAQTSLTNSGPILEALICRAHSPGRFLLLQIQLQEEDTQVHLFFQIQRFRRHNSGINFESSSAEPISRLSPVVTFTDLHYDNMLFAQIDAVYSALGSLGFKKLPVHISETGWPSKGDEDEVGATPENAKKYNGNLIKLICQKKGTPLRPGSDLNIYVFALFNENMKPGRSSERNFGLFKPDGSPAYSIRLSTGNISFGKL